MTARCSTSAACNASYTFRGTTPVSIVVYSFFSSSTQNFPFVFSKLRGLCVCVWPRSTWRSLSSKYFLCYWPWRDDKFQSPSERTGDPGRWKSTRPRIAAFSRFSFWLWIYFGLALHGRHTAGGVHPRFPFRPSPSFCDGASLDGNDFRCETIGCKVEKETQEEVVRFIFLQMTRADGRRRGKVSNPPREIKRRRKHFFFVRGVARAEPYPPSKPRQNH